MSPGARIPVAVLGATGSVGQRFVSLLERHPWFRAAELLASEASAGRPYGEAARWLLPTPVPAAAAGLEVRPVPEDVESPLVFSALSSEVAGPVEEEYARRGHLVVSNAGSHRLDPDVPLLVPEVNPDHLELLSRQQYGTGGIITNPNCSTIGLVLALKPLADAFGVRDVQVVTLQAVSGAGYPGLPSQDIQDNVIPFIAGEEEKLARECGKILGELREEGVAPSGLRVSAQCNRVPVLDGHLLCVSVSLDASPPPEAVRETWDGFLGEPQLRRLPGAPPRPVRYLADERAPQPRLHRDAGGGMTVSVGRLRPCPLLGYRFVALSHNTIRGAAGGAVLCAELALARGALGGLAPPAPARDAAGRHATASVLP